MDYESEFLLNMYMIIGFVLVITLTLVALSVIWFSHKNGIPPMPSSITVCKEFRKMIPENSNVYDLGSGWGSVLSYLSFLDKTLSLTGVESSPFPLLFSQLTTKVMRKSIHFLGEDINDVDISDVDIIYCYLYPKGMEKLADSLIERVSDGTILISNTFALPGFKPEEVIQLNDLYRTKLYRYTIRNTVKNVPTE